MRRQPPPPLPPRPKVPHWFGESARGSGNTAGVTDRGGHVARDWSDPPIYLRITGPPAAGTADYPWVQVNDADPAFPDLTAATAVAPLSGTATAGPARELNGNKWLGAWTYARGELNAAQNAVLISAVPDLYGVTTAAVAAGALGAGAVRVSAGGNVTLSPAPADVLVDVFNPWAVAVPTATKVLVAWVANQARYQFVAADCPTS